MEWKYEGKNCTDFYNKCFPQYRKRNWNIILITVLRGKTGNDGTKFCSGSSSKGSCTAENILDK